MPLADDDRVEFLTAVAGQGLVKVGVTVSDRIA
jgi:hypothetical protein